MKYHGPQDRLEAARSVNTPPEGLAALSESDYIFVREAVANNASTPAAVLQSLVPRSLESEDELRIALGLIQNPALSPDLATTIADLVVLSVTRIGPRDYYPNQLVDALVRSKNVPANSLLPLANADSIPRFIRGRIAEAGVRPELLRSLLMDRSEKIRSRARKALDTESQAGT